MVKTDFITRSFVGMGNYLALVNDEAFRTATVNSLAYIALLVPGQVGGALLIALLVCNMGKRWKDFTRISFYLPVLAAGVILAQSWRWVFAQRGLANWIIGVFGFEPVAWFSQSITGIPAIALVLSLSAMGSYVIVILAAMEGVDKSLIDAAMVDGASWPRIKTRIVLPIVWPQVAGCATLAAINAPQIYETVNFLAPYDHTASLTYQIYTQAFRLSRHGMAAAMAVVLMLATIAMTMVKQRMDRAG
jgi:multiple sugar transport system permease protein